jgi:hypothetical protein
MEGGEGMRHWTGHQVASALLVALVVFLFLFVVWAAQPGFMEPMPTL